MIVCPFVHLSICLLMNCLWNTGVTPCTVKCIQANARVPVQVHNWPRYRLVKASKVYSGSRKSWIKNLYRFYSACRQTILFTWRGGMGTIMNLVTQVLDKLLYMGTMIEP